MKSILVNKDSKIETHLNRIKTYENEDDEVVLIKKAIYFMSHAIEKFSMEAEAMRRLKEIKKNPSIGGSEKDIDEYLKKRGVKVE